MNRIALHPFLFTLLPIVTLATSNKESISLRYAVRPALGALTLASTLMVLGRLVFKGWNKASIATSMSMTLLFTFGHVADSRAMDSLGLGRQAIHTVIAFMWILAFVFTLRTLARSSHELPNFNRAITIFAAVALIPPSFELASYELYARNRIALDRHAFADWEQSAALTAPSIQPDIYYIVLDGYGGSEVLKQIYSFDNGDFLTALTERGFYIPANARSNYAQTHLSLASSLNMRYLDFLADGLGEESRNHKPIDYLIRNNLVSMSLDDLGYEIVTISSGYRRTELTGADLFIVEPVQAVSPFEAVLIEQSALRLPLELAPQFGFSRWYPGYDAHRRLVMFQLDELRRVSALPGPKFVFAHIISPHPPFVFASDGSPAPISFSYSAKDGDLYPGTSESYVSGYRDQVRYINGAILNLIDSIFEYSTVPPVVILQGDHGPGSQLVWDDPAATNMTERFSILNALHLPASTPSIEIDGLSPVNTFRFLFTELFDASLQQLEHRSLFSSWSLPYKFSDVTETLQTTKSHFPPNSTYP